LFAFDPSSAKRQHENFPWNWYRSINFWPNATLSRSTRPVSAQTREMINAGSIAKMKKGVRIVNAARGRLINEA